MSMSSAGGTLLRSARGLLGLRGALAPAPARSLFATAAVDDVGASQPSTSGQELRSTQLTDASLGRYYTLDMSLLPEAGRAYAGAFYAPRDPGHERRGGCKGLQAEAEATGSPDLMYRPAMAALYGAVSSGRHQRLLLTGPAGAGKSVALAGLVEWARQQGWLVLYVPSCLALVRGGYFAPRAGGGIGWDTLTSAQQVLKGMLDAHGPQLQQMPVLQGDEQRTKSPRQAQRQEEGGQVLHRDGAAVEAAAPQESLLSAAAAWGSTEAAGRGEAGARTLHDVIMRGLKSDEDAYIAVDSVLQLVRQLGLAAAGAGAAPGGGGGGGQAAPLPPRVLFAVDDYNYLYGTSDYGVQPQHAVPLQGRRRVLRAEELVLARGMRLLESEKVGGAAVVVAAGTASLVLPAPKSLPLPAAVALTELHVPGFSEAETRNALAHYHATRHTTKLATVAEARHLFTLTQGNARELRTQASSLGVRLG